MMMRTRWTDLEALYIPARHDSRTTQEADDDARVHWISQVSLFLKALERSCNGRDCSGEVAGEDGKLLGPSTRSMNGR